MYLQSQNIKTSFYRADDKVECCFFGKYFMTLYICFSVYFAPQDKVRTENYILVFNKIAIDLYVLPQ